MSEPLLPRWTAPNTSVIFSDESSQGEKFFVLGGVFIRLPSRNYKSHIARLESKLAAKKAEYGLGVIKWEDVPRPSRKLEGYKALVRYVASLQTHVKFRCLVVKMSDYPLKKKSVTGGNSLVGYLKYYTVFLTSGIMLKQEGYFYDITIDDYSFRPETGHDSVALGRAVEHRYLNKCLNPRNRSHSHSQLSTAKEEDSNILQVVDILVGAVAFCHNGGRDRVSKRASDMRELVAVIRESYGGLPMDRPQPRGPFRIWWLTNACRKVEEQYPTALSLF